MFVKLFSIEHISQMIIEKIAKILKNKYWFLDVSHRSDCITLSHHNDHRMCVVYINRKDVIIHSPCAFLLDLNDPASFGDLARHILCVLL